MLYLKLYLPLSKLYNFFPIEEKYYNYRFNNTKICFRISKNMIQFLYNKGDGYETIYCRRRKTYTSRTSI